MGHVAGRFPNEGLRYPKHDEKPPFQTREQIERQLPGASEAEQSELVGCPVSHAPRRRGRPEPPSGTARTIPWIHPMACTAAHTGARRSELMRMKITDVDLALGIVRIREKKRARGKRTTRDVPISPTLAAVLKGLARPASRRPVTLLPRRPR